MTLGEEGKCGRSLFQEELVDHKTDLKRKLHEGKGGIPERLQRLGLGLLGNTLASRGLRRARSEKVRSCDLVLALPLDG